MGIMARREEVPRPRIMSKEIRPRRCVLCGRPVAPEYRPFCSRRCADVDLGNWLSGAYVVPSVDRLSAEDEEELEGMLRRLEKGDAEPS